MVLTIHSTSKVVEIIQSKVEHNPQNYAYSCYNTLIPMSFFTKVMAYLSVSSETSQQKLQHNYG